MNMGSRGFVGHAVIFGSEARVDGLCSRNRRYERVECLRLRYEGASGEDHLADPKFQRSASAGEKARGSGAGGNSYSPSVKARPAPTALPGVVTGDPRR